MKPDYLTYIAVAAAVISAVLQSIPYLSRLKGGLRIVLYLALGFSIGNLAGRTSPTIFRIELAPFRENVFTIFVLVLMVAVVLFGLIILLQAWIREGSFSKVGDPVGVFAVAFLVLVIIYGISHFAWFEPSVSVQDWITLAKDSELHGDFASAIKRYTSAVETIREPTKRADGSPNQDAAIRDLITRKIVELQERQLKNADLHQ